MIHAAALAGTIIWLGLNGLLWYVRPSGLLWLLGSSILGALPAHLWVHALDLRLRGFARALRLGPPSFS